MAEKKTKTKDTTIKRAVTQAEWDEVAGLYLKGVELSEICKKYKTTNMTPARIRSKMKRDGISWRKEQISTEVKDRIAEEMINEKVETIRRIVGLYNSSLDVLGDILQEYKNDIVLGASKPKATAYNMDQLSGALNKCHNGLKMALGIEDKPAEENTAPKIVTVEGIDLKDI